MQVFVQAYDPTWPDKFARQSLIVSEALGPAVVAIHHIGSTSIPGIHAKPIIDMLVEATSVEKLDRRNQAIIALGYEALGEFGIPGRRYYRKDNTAGYREYQVHAFAVGSPEIERHFAFRDFVAAHPAVARQYAELKQRLAIDYPADIEGYSAGKDAFMKEMIARAVQWKRRTEE